MSPYLAIILAALLGDLVLSLVARWLNLRAADPKLPPEFAAVWDAERYARSQAYLKANARFATLVEAISTPALIAFLLAGGFGLADRWARSAGFGPLGTGLLFLGGLALAAGLLSLPADIWRTFVIEERFGFNRTKPGTFVLDRLKGQLLAAALGGPLLGLVLWLFESQGPGIWWLVFAAVAGFELLVAFVSPAWLMPLYYRFRPLPEGELRTAIEDYARARRFGARGIYTVDGSRRSTKANAFFAGFGRSRRIALFDTLVERHPPAEIVAVLAHEIGHAKHRHVLASTLLSLLTVGLLCFLFSLFVDNPGLQRAIGVERPSVGAGLLAFGLLFGPLNLVLGVAGNALSRRFERAADGYAARTTGDPAALAAALRRLAADSLANLTPHPLFVFLHYSHPPVLERVRRLEAMAGHAGDPAA